MSVQIREPGNALSEVMSHSIALDEFGRVFDPNPQYGKFNSLREWQAAVPHPHEILFATEVFQYSWWRGIPAGAVVRSLKIVSGDFHRADCTQK
jgi:hypothetical protein